MKTDIIRIDNQGNGFSEAMNQTVKIAEYNSLNPKDSIHLQIMTEELLSLVRSITGSLNASFWIENDARYYELHLSTRSDLTKEKRTMLLQSATSGKNEAASSFIGRLRDFLEQASAPQANDIPDDVLNKLLSHEELPENTFRNMENAIEASTWDEYEKSILHSISDSVLIAIRGNLVDITVVKTF